ncbi:MAG: hypothetical protein KA201_02225 [Kofleriaceae bacterium]|nr:hypothetical protein [Kofleriaceae bacterium]
MGNQLAALCAALGIVAACKAGSRDARQQGGAVAPAIAPDASAVTAANPPPPPMPTSAPPPPMPTSAPPPPMPTSAPSPALPELITEALYRAPGGGAQARLPSAELLGAGWTRQLRHDGGVAVIQLAYRAGGQRAQVELRFPPHQAAAIPARALAEASAAVVAKQIPGAAIVGGQALPLPGGDAWGVALATTAAGAAVTLGVVAVTDGGDAVIVTTMAHAALFDAPAVKPVLDALFAGLQVGRKVARAPSLTPPTALTGVFIRIGPALGEVHLVAFDPRGWALDERDAGAIDVDAAYAIRGGALARYQVVGDVVQVTYPAGARDDFQRNGPDLTLDGRSYCHAAATDGLTLAGRWASSSFTASTNVVGETFTASASSSYTFTRDGRYADASTASATLSQPVAPGDPARPTTTAGASADDGPGTYRIRGDRLWLTRGGATRAVPFYLRACGSDPQAMLIIDGALYLRDD